MSEPQGLRTEPTTSIGGGSPRRMPQAQRSDSPTSQPPVHGTNEPTDRSDSERRALADRITEDVLQLLFTAHQDLAELPVDGTVADPALVQSARECTLGAISILRTVATTILDAAWGPRPYIDNTDTAWDRKAPVLFDALTDAWIVTCEHEDLLFASETACRLLGRSRDELSRLMRDGTGWAQIVAALPRTTEQSTELVFELEVPMSDGRDLPIRIHSHALPVIDGLAHSYISLITERT